jgi:hypothetical protein
MKIQIRKVEKLVAYPNNKIRMVEQKSRNAIMNDLERTLGRKENLKDGENEIDETLNDLNLCDGKIF